jgi:hypothetical protein
MKVRRIAFLGLAVVTAIGAIVAACYVLSEGELEIYKARLRAQGERLSLAELRPNRTSQTNKESAEWVDHAQRLGNSEAKIQPPLEMMRYVGRGTARVFWAQSSVKIENVGKMEEFPWSDLHSQMIRAEPVLSELRRALQRPPADLGWDYQNPLASPRPPLIPLRQAVQWLAAAAADDLNRGELGAARANVLAIIDGARVHRHEWGLVEQMVRVAVAGLGIAATWEGLQAQGWADADLAQIQAAWQELRLLQEMPATCEMERAAGLYYLAYVRTNGMQGLFTGAPSQKSWTDYWDEIVLEPVWKHGFSDSDELLFLQTMQEILDAIRIEQNERSWLKMQPVLSNAMARATSPISKFGSMKYRFTPMAIANWERALHTAAKTETLKQMTIGAIAIKRHELAHGRPPARLEELVPQFLTEIPRDLMDGGHIRYLVGDNGDYTLYSVGENGVDDGGDPSDSKESPRRELWAGRDAVWPRGMMNDE